MTNAEIIFIESMELVKEGKLQLVNDLPEPIHTFAKWKSMGYNVKKGEKAIAKITIWKYSQRTRIDDAGNEIDVSKCFPKTSAFFKTSQVEKVAVQ